MIKVEVVFESAVDVRTEQRVSQAIKRTVEFLCEDYTGIGARATVSVTSAVVSATEPRTSIMGDEPPPVRVAPPAQAAAGLGWEPGDDFITPA